MTIRTLVFAAATSVSTFTAQSAHAQFKGDLAFTPDGCMTKRECILKNDLQFIDPDQRVWQADAGDLTDGASIPDWAQNIIGGPWDEAYLKAAVLHDHYCEHHLASWRDTHLMFYDALIDLGMSEVKAKVMYYAVYLGGPRWIDVLKPVDCGGRTIVGCVKDKTLRVVKSVMQPAHYGAMNMNDEMKAVEDMMKIKPDTSLADLEKMAQERHPDDMFYKFGGGILEERAEARGVR